MPDASAQVVKPLSPPKTIRGVHVTMALASIPGKLDEYLTSVRELERRLVKDETWCKTPKPRVDAPPPQDIPNAADLIGQPLTRVFRLDENEAGEMPLITALATRLPSVTAFATGSGRGPLLPMHVVQP